PESEFILDPETSFELETPLLEPESPLPESPLPESPLPESPLPESPLPESPLPESPLPESLLEPESSLEPVSPLELSNSLFQHGQDYVSLEAFKCVANQYAETSGFKVISLKGNNRSDGLHSTQVFSCDHS
ncbi:5521_t:CDS:1, partial [Scutellospora calospora]